jgi:hypothetical protein
MKCAKYLFQCRRPAAQSSGEAVGFVVERIAVLLLADAREYVLDFG